MRNFKTLFSFDISAMTLTTCMLFAIGFVSGQTAVDIEQD